MPDLTYEEYRLIKDVKILIGRSFHPHEICNGLRDLLERHGDGEQPWPKN